MITLSCGHEVDIDFNKCFNVITKSYDREGKKALSFSTVCSSCRLEYIKNDELFENDDEATEWLTSKSI